MNIFNKETAIGAILALIVNWVIVYITYKVKSFKSRKNGLKWAYLKSSAGILRDTREITNMEDMIDFIRPNNRMSRLKDIVIDEEMIAKANSAIILLGDIKLLHSSIIMRSHDPRSVCNDSALEELAMKMIDFSKLTGKSYRPQIIKIRNYFS